MIGALIGAGLSAGANAYGSYMNAKATREAAEYSADTQSSINSQNIDFQREQNQENRNLQEKINRENIAMQEGINKRNISFQQSENAIAREREDNAHQREVADLMSAGLSPLANTSGAGAASMNAPQVQASQSVASQGIAPHADSSGFERAADLYSRAGTGLGNFISSLSGAIDNYNSLKGTQIQETAANARASLDNAQAESYQINNATLALKNLDELIFLKARIKNMDIKNEQDRIFVDHLDKSLDAQLETEYSRATLNNASAFREYSQELLNNQYRLHDFDKNTREATSFENQQEYSSRWDMPMSTSYSMPFSGPLGMYGPGLKATEGFLNGVGSLATPSKYGIFGDFLEHNKDTFGKPFQDMFKGLSFLSDMYSRFVTEGRKSDDDPHHDPYKNGFKFKR